MPYKPPLSGPEFEQMIAQKKYLELQKDSIFEPNLRFYGNIAPSTVDFIAEFDLFIYRSNDTVHLIELKAKKINEYDLYKFDIQTKRTGLIKSNLEYTTTNPYPDNIKKLAFNLGFEIRRENIEKAAAKRNITPRKYVELFLDNNDMSLYLKYHQAALNTHPGYYILLNNCWIPQYSKRLEIIQKVKDIMRIALPFSRGDNKKIIEFIYMKAKLLEMWLVTKNRGITTRDIINLIKDNSNDLNTKLTKNVVKFKTRIEDELKSKLEINDKLDIQNNIGDFYIHFKKLDNFNDLYIIIGNDKYITISLEKIIKHFKKKVNTLNIYLIHTCSEPSIEVAFSIHQKLGSQLNIDPPINYLNECHKKEFNTFDFIKFINNKANLNAALLVTYIPKYWALALYLERKRWKYFFFIDRPEIIKNKKKKAKKKNQKKTISIDLKAFELNNR